jgi:hypothetical protein
LAETEEKHLRFREERLREAGKMVPERRVARPQWKPPAVALRYIPTTTPNSPATEHRRSLRS